MWIRSQDRMELVLLNNNLFIMKLDYEDNDEKASYAIYKNNGNDKYTTLGIYDGFTRAESILDEIQENIETRVVADELMKSMIDTMTDESDKETYTERLRKLSCVYVMPEV